MQNTLTIHSLKCGDILGQSFYPLTSNNVIEFSKNGIAVVYGPNGAGKTTITRIFSKEPNTEYEIEINDVVFTNNDDMLFHIIADQLGRNIISGSTKEYFLGENIAREYELHDLIEKSFKELFDDMLISALNTRFNIVAKSSPLVKKITNPIIKKYVESLVNKQDKGRKLDKRHFIASLKELSLLTVPEYDLAIFNFIISDYVKGTDSIIKTIEDLDLTTVKKDQDYRVLEETDTAISILDKYSYRDECIICDTAINPLELIEKKKNKKEKVYVSLSDATKKILENVIVKISDDDPLHLKHAFLVAIKDGELSSLEDIRKTVKEYFIIFNSELTNLFTECSGKTEIIALSDEYEQILSKKPEINEEDLQYIEEIVNENIDRNISIKRDKNNNLKIYIDETELLNTQREDLFLSTGEQNFISLSFELLKAKNTKDKIIVIDDPISSFDSIYKNKIAFSILKTLAGKKQIIFTHNTELVRLLEHQRNGSFNLYLLNKTTGEINGFIPIAQNEVDLLLRIDKIVSLLRSDVSISIKDQEYFLLSLIPFMRGFAHIIGDQEKYTKLTSVMHGYLDEPVNVSEMYKELFGPGNRLNKNVEVTAKNIADMSISRKEILDSKIFPLLDRTLNHSLVYLHLRLNVEKKLVEKYKINTDENYMLADIIMAAFDGKTKESRRRRVFLTSKKTLLNEFNHFEGNMNIFQPAIDISDSALEKEKASIDDFLMKL